MNLKHLLLYMPVVMFLARCSGPEKNVNLIGTDIRLFEHTPAWDLAKAVQNDDIDEINKIVLKHKVPVDYQEHRFGESLLLWAVWTNHYKSTEALLKNGADPNLQDHYNGNSAFMHAAAKYETSGYVSLLLKYRANPNAVAKNDSNNIIVTPLIAAAGARLESVRLLVNAGANINYADKQKQTALSTAFTSERVDIVYYLLIEKGADFKKSFGKTIQGHPIMITDLLRTWVFPLSSENYKKKMLIVKYLKDRGMDYYKSHIPSYYYKNYSKDFLDKY